MSNIISNKITYFIYPTLAILILLIMMIGCTPKDPSVYDLKSPCVANEYTNSKYSSKNSNNYDIFLIQDKDPCFRRPPQMNGIYNKKHFA